VSATVALMLSANPALTPDQVSALLRSTARAFPTRGAPDDPDVGPIRACQAPNGVDQLQCYCTTSTCGAGMLDAGAAVAAASTYTPPPPPASGGGGGGGGALTPAWLLALAAACAALRRSDRR
jgi:serine protease